MNPYILDPAEHAAVLIELLGGHDQAVEIAEINLEGPCSDPLWWRMVRDVLKGHEA